MIQPYYCRLFNSKTEYTLAFFHPQGNVFMYYGLSNFYQNHRRYVKSRDDSQLNGDLSSLKVWAWAVDVQLCVKEFPCSKSVRIKTCSSLVSSLFMFFEHRTRVRNVSRTAWSEAHLSPLVVLLLTACLTVGLKGVQDSHGLIDHLCDGQRAWSLPFLADSLELIYLDPNGTRITIPLIKKGIAWWTDKHVKFRNPGGSNSNLTAVFQGKILNFRRRCKTFGLLLENA